MSLTVFYSQIHYTVHSANIILKWSKTIMYSNLSHLRLPELLAVPLDCCLEWTHMSPSSCLLPAAVSSSSCLRPAAAVSWSSCCLRPAARPYLTLSWCTTCWCLLLDLPRCPYNYSSSSKYVTHQPELALATFVTCLIRSLLYVAVVSKLCCHHYPPVSPWLVSVVPLLRPPPAVMAPTPRLPADEESITIKQSNVPCG